MHISEYKDYHTGLGIINATVNGTVVSKLYYKEHPIITYTSNKNPDDYVYIEWIETKDAHRNKGYANIIVNHLVNKFPNKTVIARANSQSNSLMAKNKVLALESLVEAWSKEDDAVLDELISYYDKTDIHKLTMISEQKAHDL